MLTLVRCFHACISCVHTTQEIRSSEWICILICGRQSSEMTVNTSQQPAPT